MSALVAVFGFCLFSMGTMFLWRLMWTRKTCENRFSADEELREHLALQYHRRMLIAGINIALGLMIPLGFEYFRFHPEPRSQSIFGLTAFFLCIAMVILAVADCIAIVRRTRRSRQDVLARRRQLEAELLQLREQLRLER